MEENNLSPESQNPVLFNAKEVFAKTDNFQCNSLGFPSNEERNYWLQKTQKEFNKDLEDLMRRYKVVQVVATIFSKL